MHTIELEVWTKWSEEHDYDDCQSELLTVEFDFNPLTKDDITIESYKLNDKEIKLGILRENNPGLTERIQDKMDDYIQNYEAEPEDK